MPKAFTEAEKDLIRARLVEAGEQQFSAYGLKKANVDELARAAGMEPLSFRMSMLGGNGRLARCLQAATRLAGWDGGGAGSTMGLAGASAFGSHIGLVASASIGEDQKVKVHRLVAATRGRA